MKHLTLVLAFVLLAAVATLLWRLERNTAVLAELARVQLADREEYRREEQTRRAIEEMHLPESDWFMEHCLGAFEKNLDELGTM